MEKEEKSEGPQWYCLRTQTKREHIAAGYLRNVEECEVFCPRLRYRKATRRGKIWWVEAMFPGYLFARFDFVMKSRQITHTTGISTILHFGDYVPAVPETIIEKLKDEFELGEETLTIRPKLEEGDEVELAGGAFSGLSGRVLEVPSGNERVKILIEFLGNEHPLEVDMLDLILPKYR